MRFAIRDDDTNYFTSPDEIVYCYDKVWDICPPSLSLISYVQGNWRAWQDEFYTTGAINDWVRWEADNTVHPIHENEELIKFLKEKSAEGKISLTVHGVNHRNKDGVKPVLKNNLVHYAEFYTALDLTDELKGAKRYLEKLFQQPFTVFTPPQNALTQQGYQAIVNSNLALVGGGIPFMAREKTIQWVPAFVKWLFFKMLHRNQYYPFVIDLGNRKEIMVHYPLQEVTKIEYLIDSFNVVESLNGDFILSTHYHGFPVNHKMYPGKKMKDIFDEFFDFVKNKKGVEFCTLNQLLS